MRTRARAPDVGNTSYLKLEGQISPKPTGDFLRFRSCSHPDQRPEICRLPLFSYDRLSKAELEKGWVWPPDPSLSKPVRFRTGVHSQPRPYPHVGACGWTRRTHGDLWLTVTTSLARFASQWQPTMARQNGQIWRLRVHWQVFIGRSGAVIGFYGTRFLVLRNRAVLQNRACKSEQSVTSDRSLTV